MPPRNLRLVPLRWSRLPRRSSRKRVVARRSPLKSELPRRLPDSLRVRLALVQEPVLRLEQLVLRLEQLVPEQVLLLVPLLLARLVLLRLVLAAR